MKLTKTEDGLLMFQCPGCGYSHGVTVKGSVRQGPEWGWNGSMDKPTFTPSLNVNGGYGRRCHSFVKDGKIQFLGDCDHSLKGQTVEIPEWEP